MHRALLGDEFPLGLDTPFTFTQAREAGISRRHLAQLVEEGLLRRLLRGVYVAAQAPDTLLLRARALRLVVPAGFVVTDEGAGWLAGAPMILRPGSHLATPPLTVFATPGHDRLRNGLTDSGSRGLLPRDLHEIYGVLATTPLRTALDLGRLRHRDRAISDLDQLMGLGVTHDQMWAEEPRFRGMRGVRQLRSLIPLADPRSESPGESALRLRFHDGGLPIPEPQVDILDATGRFLGRGDLVIEELGFVAEYDGAAYHGPEQQEHDDERRGGLEGAGWTVCVVRRGNLYGPRQDVEQLLRRDLRRARLRLADPSVAGRRDIGAVSAHPSGT